MGVLKDKISELFASLTTMRTGMLELETIADEVRSLGLTLDPLTYPELTAKMTALELKSDEVHNLGDVFDAKLAELDVIVKPNQ